MRGAEQTLCPGQSFQKCRCDEKQRRGGKVEGAKESFYRRLLEHTCVLPRVIQQRERLVRNKRACHNEEVILKKRNKTRKSGRAGF